MKRPIWNSKFEVKLMYTMKKGLKTEEKLQPTRNIFSIAGEGKGSKIRNEICEKNCGVTYVWILINFFLTAHNNSQENWEIYFRSCSNKTIIALRPGDVIWKHYTQRKLQSQKSFDYKKLTIFINFFRISPLKLTVNWCMKNIECICN